MAHPVAGDVDGNIARAATRLIELKRENPGYSVVAPWIFDVQAFDDSIPELREEGLLRCMEAIATCDELWITGDEEAARASEGIRREREHAYALGIPVREKYTS